MKILVVEDYEPLRRSLVQGLREAGFTVDVAEDGPEGLWLAQGEDYDVLVLDLMLPGLGGEEVLRRLRAAGKETHVLVLTARDAVEQRVATLNAGADDYLTKPFAFEELLARIHALVRRRYGRKDPLLRVGDLELDRGARKARRAERELGLTQRQFALLEVLALRAGEVVPRDALWAQLYDFQAEPNSNLLEVYVAQLRRKLEAGGEPRLIQTRRGVGYVLEAEA
ncbi:MAG: response regulator [Planctomycetota bacterium]